ncbi:uncharacterized protein LTR77_004390 [Saxophila tyrrhenica]|uniref:Uncharacterized protein n=1 Tax=Saxophila tyrrhenica TaxID=1690608 RepID=A0AAV9PDH2_9PEZI|nr:hypothetical protein LTR77_004390 [Saxophila tyrrhenica]
MGWRDTVKLGKDESSRGTAEEHVKEVPKPSIDGSTASSINDSRRCGPYLTLTPPDDDSEARIQRIEERTLAARAMTTTIGSTLESTTLERLPLRVRGRKYDSAFLESLNLEAFNGEDAQRTYRRMGWAIPIMCLAGLGLIVVGQVLYWAWVDPSQLRNISWN